VLNFATISASEGNDLPYVMFLPTYAASAYHHRQLSAELLDKPMEKVVKEAEQFAIGDYLLALSRGAALPEDQRKAVAEKLAKYSGLPVAFVDRADLRVSPGEFRKQLLWEARQIIGRFDSRIVGYDAEATRNVPDFDPSYPQYLSAYSGAFNEYVRRELRFESDLPYEVLTDRVQPWNWGRGNTGYVNVASDLQAAMIRNPHMRVMFAQGYFDLATPHFASDYVVNRLDLSRDLRRNIVQTYYTGGHMMYHNRADLKKLHDDVTAFIRQALDRKGSEPVAGGEGGR
jgi:carboxypeptidase C (cathepsin A)